MADQVQGRRDSVCLHGYGSFAFFFSISVSQRFMFRHCSNEGTWQRGGPNTTVYFAPLRVFITLLQILFEVRPACYCPPFTYIYSLRVLSAILHCRLHRIVLEELFLCCWSTVGVVIFRKKQEKFYPRHRCCSLTHTHKHKSTHQATPALPIPISSASVALAYSRAFP